MRKTSTCTGATPHLVRCANFTGQLWTLMSTLDAELNDFGAQLAMLGGHAADRDG